MTDEYDACSDSEILHLFQLVAMSNKLSLILMTFLKFFLTVLFFKKKPFSKIYGVAALPKKRIKLFVVACWGSTVLEIVMLKIYATFQNFGCCCQIFEGKIQIYF